MRRKRPFSRRRSRKGAKRDILTLSLCRETTIIDRAAGDPLFSCTNPAISVNPLCIGGGTPEGGLAPGPTGTPLSTEGVRGASVRSIQFDLSGFCSCWINTTASLNNQQTQSSFLIGHYMGICRAEYDVLTYEQTGVVTPVWARPPNIILSGQEIASALPDRPLHDPDVEIFWRGYDEAIADFCLDCPPCCNPGCPAAFTGEACSLCGTLGGPQFFAGIVRVIASGDTKAMARNYALRHVKLRTGRFLKENQALFWVENFVTNLPEGCQVLWATTLFGTAAVRVAR